MVRAFIMVKAAPGEAEPVLEAVEATEFVDEAHVVAGEFDIIAEVEADEVSDLLRSAGNSIRGVESVHDTRTYVCLE